MNRFRKGGMTKGEDKGIPRNKCIIPAKTDSALHSNTLSRQFSSLPIPSKSHDQISSLDESTEKCMVTMIGRVQRVFE